MQTGTASCRSCRGIAEDCPQCGGRSATALGGAASLRGRLWAEEVVRRLLERWPARWPRTATMLEKAAQHVEDLARSNDTLRAYLVKVCVAGAAGRYDELVGYLAGRRLDLPRWRARRLVLFRDPVPPALLTQVLAQERSRRGIEEAHAHAIPLHLHAPSDPAGRRAVVGGVDLDSSVKVHGALAVLVVAKRLDRKLTQMRLLLGKHDRDLALGRALDPRVGPVRLPAIEIGLRLVDGLEAQSFGIRSAKRGSSNGFVEIVMNLAFARPDHPLNWDAER